MWLAVRYRRLQALLILLLSALVTVCAVLTPLYYRAILQELTHRTVETAGPAGTSLRVTSDDPGDIDLVPIDQLPPVTDHRTLAGLLPDRARAWFRAPIDSTSLLVSQRDLTRSSPVGELLWRDDACAHLRFVAGRCPTASREIAVSAADQQNFGLDPGSTVQVVERSQIQNVRVPVRTITVTGVYRQPDDDYWAGRRLTGLSGTRDPAPPNQPYHDTWVTPGSTFTRPGGADWLRYGNEVDYVVRKPVDYDRLQALGAAAGRAINRQEDLKAGIGDQNGYFEATLRSGLPAIARTVERGRHQALVTVPLLMIQLSLLGLVVLGLVLGAAVEQRRPEMALARIRGAGRRGARRLLVRELMPVVLLGVPLGTGVALVVAALLRRFVLGGDVPFELRSGFWSAVVGSTVVLGLVTWTVAYRGTRDQIALLLRSVPIRSQGWAIGAGDAVVVAACGSAVLAFVTGGLRGPMALAAPALLALMVGLLLAHALVPVASWLGGRLLRRGRYAGGVSLLAIARRPATRRVVAIVTVASALLVFSVDAVRVGSRNRDVVARQVTGAPMTADVSNHDVRLVRKALAESGVAKHVTPVAAVAVGDDSVLGTLAVVPSGFRRIAFLDPSARSLPWRRLTPSTGRRIALRGRSVSMTVTPHTLSLGGPVALQLDLISEDGDRSTVGVGYLPSQGPRTLRAVVPCARGCTVAAFRVRAVPGIDYDGELTISDVRVDGGTTTFPGRRTDWQRAESSDQNAFVAPVDDSTGSLDVRLFSTGKPSGPVVSRYLPEVLPAFIAGARKNAEATLVPGTSLDRGVQDVSSVGYQRAVPGRLDDVAVVDLGLLQRGGARVSVSGQLQVWFDSESHRLLDVVRAALRKEGADLTDVRRYSEIRHGYDVSVPAWSLQLGLVTAALGLVIAGAVLVLLVVSTWRRRARDLACLRMSGVARTSGIALGEQLPVVVLAVVAGAVCGVVGAVFALPTVPLFARRPAGIPLDFSPPWAAIGVALAVDLAVLGLVAWVSALALVRRADHARVREGR